MEPPSCHVVQVIRADLVVVVVLAGYVGALEWNCRSAFFLRWKLFGAAKARRISPRLGFAPIGGVREHRDEHKEHDEGRSCNGHQALAAVPALGAPILFLS